MVPGLKIATGESPFVPAILIISQEPSVEVDGAGTRVVNLNPVGVLTIVILQRGIVGLDFRDNRIDLARKKDSYA
jgi:hypothetical protein